MRRFRTRWGIPLALALLLAISLWWGYEQLRLQRLLTVQLENSYQRAFHELVWNIRTVENELAMLSAAGGLNQQMQSLATVWRQVYAAQENVGQLPLGLVPLDESEAYLSQVGDYVFSLVTKGAGLSDEERARVAQLQQSAAKIGDQLASLQANILQQNILWTDVQKALVKARREDEVRDNTVVNGFQLVNKEVQEFPEVALDQRIGVAQPPPTALTGEKVTQEEALDIARWFLSPGDKNAYLLVSSELTGGPIPTYRFVFTPNEGDRRITVEVTERGGKVFWMLDNRVPTAVQVPAAALSQQASAWLRRRGYHNLQLIGLHEYQGSVLFAFVYEQDGVLVYPDLLRLRVASDDGSVIGFEGNGYVAYHREQRQLPEPQVSLQQALSKLASGLQQVGPAQMAVIFNARAEEALVYEIPVSRNMEGGFLVYIDAQDGEEVQIVRLDAASLPVQAALAEPATMR
ncbi:MAG: germination protein YpeB [Bacillota bacterium]|jgi:spore germination protein